MKDTGRQVIKALLHQYSSVAQEYCTSLWHQPTPFVLYAKLECCHLRCMGNSVTHHVSRDHKPLILLAGCAAAVFTAICTLLGTWGYGFLMVLAGSWLHKLWSKHEFGNLFTAVYVLAIGLHAEHTAGFSASFLRDLSSIQLEQEAFQGLLKVPAPLVEAISEAHVEAWRQMTHRAVCSHLPFRNTYSCPILGSISAHHDCRISCMDVWQRHPLGL